LAPGRTKVSARYGSFEAQADVLVFPEEPIAPSAPPPPSPERLRPVYPPDGYVAQVGERLRLEVTPFDISQGYTFYSSSWSVYKIHPETGKRAPVEAAFLRRGNSEKAEWIPRGTGTFEWEVTYHYVMGPRASGKIPSFPQRIVVVN